MLLFFGSGGSQNTKHSICGLSEIPVQDSTVNKQTLSLVHVCIEGQDALTVGVSATPVSAMIGSEKDKCPISGPDEVVGCEQLPSVLTVL